MLAFEHKVGVEADNGEELRTCSASTRTRAPRTVLMDRYRPTKCSCVSRTYVHSIRNSTDCGGHADAGCGAHTSMNDSEKTTRNASSMPRFRSFSRMMIWRVS